MTSQTNSINHSIAFIGGGNMATAIIGGLIQRGMSATKIQVVEPSTAQCNQLVKQFGIRVMGAPEASLSSADIVIWAVKPQIFRDATRVAVVHTQSALHLSVAAGIPTDSIAVWLNTERIVRSMPNTPTAIGQGMTGLFARESVNAADRAAIEQITLTTGDCIWLQNEGQLNAVTALSGSGPAYVFYFLEAMTQAGVEMGLPREQAYRLAIGTFSGTAALAAASSDAPDVLRARVTSKGGTTYAAITAMEEARIGPQFVQAMHAAERRAVELGDEFGMQ